jgi:hypothetical protein
VLPDLEQQGVQVHRLPIHRCPKQQALRSNDATQAAEELIKQNVIGSQSQGLSDSNIKRTGLSEPRVNFSGAQLLLESIGETPRYIRKVAVPASEQRVKIL